MCTPKKEVSNQYDHPFLNLKCNVTHMRISAVINVVDYIRMPLSKGSPKDCPHPLTGDIVRF